MALILKAVSMFITLSIAQCLTICKAAHTVMRVVSVKVVMIVITACVVLTAPTKIISAI